MTDPQNLMEFCANCLSPFLLSVDNFDGGGGDGDNLMNFGLDEEPSNICQRRGIHRDIYIEETIPTEDDDDFDPINYFSSEPLTTTTTTRRRRKIVIKDAVSAMYQLCYLDLFKDIDDEDNNLQENGDNVDDEDDDIGVCSRCASLVEKMYSAYDEFNRVRRQNSFFYKKIQKLDRIMHKLQANFQSSINHNTTTTITVKFENHHQEKELFDHFDDDGGDGGGGLPIEQEEVIFGVEPSEIETLELRTKSAENVVSQSENVVSQNETQDNLSFTSSSLRKPVLDGPPWLKLRRLTRSQISKYKAKTGRSHGKVLTMGNNDFLNLVDGPDDDKNDFDEQYCDKDDDDYIPDEPKQPKSNKPKTFRRNKKTDTGSSSAAGAPKKRKRVRIQPKKEPFIRPIPIWKQYATVITDTTMVMEEGSEKTVCNKYLCKICGKGYTSVSGIKLHIHGHRGDKPYKCEYGDCTKSFMSRNALTLHTMIHTGEKVQCSICSKFFNSPLSLAQHVKVLHDNIKQFLCNECGRKFANATILRKHLQIHSDLRQYKCQKCGKSFKQNHLLSRHKLTHEDKKYLCPTCGIGFSRGDSLKAHVTKHHPEQCSGQ